MSEVDTLRTRVTELEAERDEVISERDEITQRLLETEQAAQAREAELLALVAAAEQPKSTAH